MLNKETIINLVIEELHNNQELRDRLSRLLCREEIILRGKNIKIEVKK